MWKRLSASALALAALCFAGPALASQDEARALALAYAALETSTIDGEGCPAALTYEAMIIGGARNLATTVVL